MAIHILKPDANAHPQHDFRSLQFHLKWLRRMFRLRARVQQQQQVVSRDTAMESLYALAVAVADEHGLD